jgi:hypothetical protein
MIRRRDEERLEEAEQQLLLLPELAVLIYEGPPEIGTVIG